MKAIVTTLLFLTLFACFGQDTTTGNSFVSDYMNYGKNEDLEKLLMYYDSINAEVVGSDHCWQYCLEITIIRNTVYVYGDSLVDLDALPGIIYQFLINPKKFRLNADVDNDFELKGRVEISYDHESEKTGRTVINKTLAGFKRFAAALESEEIKQFNEVELSEYILNHVFIRTNISIPEP